MMTSVKENIIMVIIAGMLSSVLYLAGCQNIDREALKTKIVDGSEKFVSTVCDDKYAASRKEMIALALANYPQFPAFDVCPLITHHSANVDTAK